MAQLVLGIGTSHSPQLSVSWDGWAMRGEADKQNPALIGTDGIVSGYDDLLARADVTRIARETETLEMKWSTYVPCYRSPAGTGCAMAFAEWS